MRKEKNSVNKTSIYFPNPKSIEFIEFIESGSVTLGLLATYFTMSEYNDLTCIEKTKARIKIPNKRPWSACNGTLESSGYTNYHTLNYNL